jgi:hypothetical protein
VELTRKVYGDNCLSRAQIFRWYARFKSGVETTEDEARPVRKEGLIARVREQIQFKLERRRLWCKARSYTGNLNGQADGKHKTISKDGQYRSTGCPPCRVHHSAFMNSSAAN